MNLIRLSFFLLFGLFVVANQAYDLGKSANSQIEVIEVGTEQISLLLESASEDFGNLIYDNNRISEGQIQIFNFIILFVLASFVFNRKQIEIYILFRKLKVELNN